MILGLGVDVVDVDRFARTMERTPALRDRLFTVDEAPAQLPVRSVAARFAAKEALVKALGAPPGLAWHDAEVLAEPSGRPVWRLHGTVAAAVAELGATRTHLSLSHDGPVATATVILEG